MDASTTDRHLDVLSDLIDRSKAAGADAADAMLVDGRSVSVAVRLGELENLERAEGQDVSLRVFVGKRQAIASSSDIGPKALDTLIERAVAMARSVPEDEFAGLADPDQIAASVADVECYDPTPIDDTRLTDWARAAEDAARGVDGVTNSEGAEASWSVHALALVGSNGFAQTRIGSTVSVSASVIAGSGTAMERDYDYDSRVFVEDLIDPAEIGRSAGERAVKRLGARKPKTGQVPVVYDPRVSNSLVRHFAGAANGAAVARGTSFLKEAMGTPVFADGVVIVDDPLRARGLRSKPFDAEGVATQRHTMVDDGVLKSWFLDVRSARQLGLETTGHAARGTASPPSPSPTNLYMQAGAVLPEDLIADIEAGFYVTELVGMGVNSVTGDYSRGAGGFWIENGAIAYPVSEATIAGNLKSMFKALTPASDLVFRRGTDAPTIRVDGMTVAGA
jgi:PmbA protein